MIVAELICRCFHSRTEAHLFHLQTKSYAAHKALNEYYDEIIPLADALAESYQGRYGIVTDYPEEYEQSETPVDMLKDLRAWIDTNRHEDKNLEKSELQNLIDEIVTLINGTLYKLETLK